LKRLCKICFAGVFKSVFARFRVCLNARYLFFGLVLLFNPYLNAKSLYELAKSSLKDDLIESYKYNAQSISYGSYEAFSKYLPQINANYKDDKYSKTSPSNINGNKVTSVSANIVLFDGFKRYNAIRGALAYNRYSNNNLKNSEQNVILELIKAYYSYLSNQEEQIAKKQEIQQLKAQQDRLRKFYSAGASTKEDVLLVEASLANAKVALFEIQARGIDTLDYIKYIANTPNPNPDKQSVVYLPKSFAKQPNAFLKSLQADVETAKYSANAKLGDYLPSVSLSQTHTKITNDYDNKKSTNDEQDITSISVSWNLFSSGGSFASWESAHKAYLSKKKKLRYERAKLYSQYSVAKENLKIETQRVKALQISVKATSRAYVSVLKKYKHSIVSYVVYLQALQDKYNASAKLAKAKNNLQVKKAELIYYGGGDLIEFLKPQQYKNKI